jgi:hypothetical protein
MAQTGPSSAKGHSKTAQDEEQDDDDDDGFGLTLPQSKRDLFHATPSSRPGPSIPNLRDLQQAREPAAEDTLASRKQVSKDLRADRKAEQAVRKSDLDEVAPRAEPGAHEGQLEKRRELTTSNRAFASVKTDPADFELLEADVMGREEGLGELKRLKEIEERKRSGRGFGPSMRLSLYTKYGSGAGPKWPTPIFSSGSFKEM